MTRLVRRVVGAVAILLGTWGIARDASAAGFASARFGGEQGSVVATNPTSLYFNPAGMAFSEGIHLYLDGEIAMRDATWTHTAPALAPGDATYSQVGNSGTAKLFNVFGGPALGATMKFGNLAIGAGLFVPFGGRVNWGTNDTIQTSSPLASSPKAAFLCTTAGACPLAAGGVQRWHMSTAALTFLQASVGAAYKFGPLAIGVTGNFMNSQITQSQSRTLAGSSIDSTQEDIGALDVSGNNLSFAAGAMLEAIKNRLWLAASYQAQPGLGPQTLTGTLNFRSGPSPYYMQSGTVNYNVDFHESLPDIVRAGARLRVTDKVELRLFGDYTRWSVMTSQCLNQSETGTACSVYGPGGDLSHPLGGDSTANRADVLNIPRNWKDTYGLRLGGSYFASPRVELFAGVGYETGAAPDSTLEPGAMDGDNIAGALGGRFLVADGFYLAGSYTHIQFLNRNVTDSQLAVSNGTPVSAPSLQQDGNGQYTQWIGIFDVNAEKQF